MTFPCGKAIIDPNQDTGRHPGDQPDGQPHAGAAVTPAQLTASGGYDSPDLQNVINKLNELINALHR
jgi:hypothetical protein